MLHTFLLNSLDAPHSKEKGQGRPRWWAAQHQLSPAQGKKESMRLPVLPSKLVHFFFLKVWRCAYVTVKWAGYLLQPSSSMREQERLLFPKRLSRAWLLLPIQHNPFRVSMINLC